jgi:hypothetical protein
MRRMALVVLLLVVTATACGTDPAWVAHGRQASWQRVRPPAFTAGTSSSILGLVAPGDGYASWAAVGSITQLTTAAVAWTSTDGTRWGRTDLDDGDALGSVANAGARRQGVLVVVGTVTSRLGDRDGAVWSSKDGANWSAATVAAGGPGDQSLTRVAGGPLGFVAAGLDGSVPAVWTSPDGQAWTRADGPFLESERIKGVAVGPQGAVAVGTITTSGDLDGMAWFSADGTTWRTVPLGTAGFAGRTSQAVHAVTATPGGFVAVGEDANGERRVAVAWTSADGITWQRQPPSDLGVPPGTASTGGVSAGDVAGSGPLVAVGGSALLQVWGSADGRRWTQQDAPQRSAEGSKVATDGRAVLVAADGLWLRGPADGWTEVGADALVFPRPTRSYGLNAMTSTGGRMVAFGRAGGEPAEWTSPDGLRWERLADAGGVFASGSVSGLTRLGRVIVAGGTVRDSSGHNVGAVWTSADDGSTWERAEPGNPAWTVRQTTQIFGVATGGPGVVAVGLSWDGVNIDAQAWSSPDGRAWRRASEPAEWSGPGDQILSVVCGLPGGGVVALGTVTVLGEQDTWAWVSQDGVTWQRASGPEAATLAGPGLQFPQACASTPAGVLVAGARQGAGGDDGVLWATADGLAWSTLAHEVFAGPLDDSLRGVAADGARIVVSGIDEGDVVFFTSSDAGATWRRRAAPAGGRSAFTVASDLAIAGDVVIAAGIDGASVAVWMGPAP